MKIICLLLLFFIYKNVAAAKCIDGDCINGTGTYVWGDGNKYSGTWKDGKPHGKGKLISPYGITYAGEWVDNKLHGYGKIIYFNGNKYIGSFKYGKRDGKGILYDKKNNILKKGSWKNDIFVIKKEKKPGKKKN
jgi:hypothetical protein